MASATATAAFTANSRHIAQFEAKPYPQQLDESTVTEAFGHLAYPKIVAGLRSNNATIKAKSVVAARELLVAPEKHIQCIAAGLTPALRDLIQQPADAAAGASQNEALQAAAATTMQLLVCKEVGCRDALQHGCLPPLLQLLKQSSTAVRDAAYGALQAAALYEPWRVALTREGALPALLLHAQEEEPQRAAVALELLHSCTQARNNEDALIQLIAVQQAVPKLAAMVSSTPPAVCLGVVKLLAALASTHQDARTQAVDNGCVPELLAHVAAPSLDLATAAACALMMLTLAKEGKVALHQAGGLAVCLDVLDAQLQSLQATADFAGVTASPLPPPPGEERLVVNVLQSITNAAEYGPCNVVLQRSPQLQIIRGLRQLSSAEVAPLLHAAASQALRMAGIKD